VHVVAYDRLGFGRSSERPDLPGPDFIREEAELIFPVLRAELGVTDFSLFGHSVGGSMALVMASRATDACRFVVGESAQAFVEDRTIAGVQAAKASFQQPEQLDRLKRWHGQKAQWVLDAWTEAWLSPAFASWSLATDLPLVKCPILVIHGDQDEYGSVRFPEFICRNAGGPTEMHILKGCGHVPHREQPDTVLDLVSRFSACSKTQPPAPPDGWKGET
jgi:pimeloyl-ACP methyl ester carboxylesterase